MPEPTSEPGPEVRRQAPIEAGCIGWVIDACGPAFAGLFLVSTAIILFEVVMRYVFDAPTLWAHETTAFLSGICFIFGGAYCLARDQHIRVVLLYDHVGPRLRRLLDIIISVIGLIATLFLSYAALTVVLRAIMTPTGDIHLETTGSAFNAPYPAIAKSFLFIVLVVMAFQFLVLAINQIRGRPSRPVDPRAPDRKHG